MDSRDKKQATIEVIVPVRDMSHHVARLLPPLVSQLMPDDEVTIVDDNSTDDTAEVAGALGARVLRLKKSFGPYYARQVAAQMSGADILLFVDARCRPKPGLLAAHRTLQAMPGVTLSCTNTRTESGPSVVERAAALQQPFRLTATIGLPSRRDYYPTANLGVERSAFLAVNGFRSMRSGGDADLCWRIQCAGLGTLGYDKRVLMTWQPRTGLRDYASQWKRYGYHAAYLQWLAKREDLGRAGLTTQLPADVGELHPQRRGIADSVLQMSMMVVYRWWLWRGHRDAANFEPPAAYVIDRDAFT